MSPIHVLSTENFAALEGFLGELVSQNWIISKLAQYELTQSHYASLNV